MDFLETLDLSIVVPVHNSAATLPACLGALNAALAFASSDSSSAITAEIIVVDDRSTDTGAAEARRLGARVIYNAARGPASARNTGVAEARGNVLLFVDSDVVVQPRTIRQVLNTLDAKPDIAAVFGSYDDEPPAQDFFSQYKNLLHHFIHQSSSENAGTFWAGCGAIRREIFEQIGGFNESLYAESSIEDIDLGVWLRESGHAILLDKSLQVKHLKRWTFTSLLHSDLFRRAKPWSELMLQRAAIPDDLNVKWPHRISALLIWLVLIFTAMLTITAHGQIHAWSPVAPCLLGALLFLNREIIAFFVARRGCVFAALAFGWLCFYYFYSSAIFAWCWLRFSIVAKPIPAVLVENEPVALGTKAKSAAVFSPELP